MEHIDRILALIDAVLDEPVPAPPVDEFEALLDTFEADLDAAVAGN